jgi:isocitrate dehydrogenase kinase/phosphatase
MSEVKFELKPITEKPSRRYRKGSKYDPVLDRFIERAANLVEVSMEGKDANYLRTQLNKRIEARNLKTIKISVVNNVCYLEKV